MIRVSILFCTLAISMTAVVQGVDPLDAVVNTTDAERFVALIEEVGGAPTSSQHQQRYLDKAGPGVQALQQTRMRDANHLTHIRPQTGGSND